MSVLLCNFSAVCYCVPLLVVMAWLLLTFQLCVVLRAQWSIKFRTPQLEHEFGRPYQLGHHKYANRPEDADLATFPVLKGDVIVMGSDGLLDNLSETEMLDEVVRLRRQKASPSQMVQRLAKLAFDSSMDKKKSTPYSKAATEAFDMVFSGGKPDDITVLVAYID